MCQNSRSPRRDSPTTVPGIQSLPVADPLRPSLRDPYRGHAPSDLRRHGEGGTPANLGPLPPSALLHLPELPPRLASPRPGIV